jgi:hypothetical protein
VIDRPILHLHLKTHGYRLRGCMSGVNAAEKGGERSPNARIWRPGSRPPLVVKSVLQDRSPCARCLLA